VVATAMASVAVVAAATSAAMAARRLQDQCI